MLFSGIFINEISVKSPRTLCISITYKTRFSVSQFPKITISFDFVNGSTDAYLFMYRYRITAKHSNNHVFTGVLTQDPEHMHAYKWRSGVDKSKAVVTHLSDDDDVSFYNNTASTWTLATPRTTWESSIEYRTATLHGSKYWKAIACLEVIHSVAVLAEISLRSPRKWFIFIIKNIYL